MQAEQERGTDKLQLWRDQIAAFTFPRWNELPEIDLYMDQVVGYLSQKLSVFYDNDDDRRRVNLAAHPTHRLAALGARLP